MTIWKPDTCGCEIAVENWGDHAPELAKARTVKACAHHAGLSHDEHLRVVYHGENRVKNEALAELQRHLPHFFYTEAQADARNRAMLTAAIGVVDPKLTAHLNLLTRYEVALHLQRAGLPAVFENQPILELGVGYEFEHAGEGQPRALTLLTPRTLSHEDKAAVDTGLQARFGKKVRVR